MSANESAALKHYRANAVEINAKRKQKYYANLYASRAYIRERLRQRRNTLLGSLEVLAAKKKMRGKDLLAIFHRQNGRCAVSGVEMTWGAGAGSGRVTAETNVSLDRIVAGAGYTIENVQLVCNVVNRIKSDLSRDELLTWCKRILDHAQEKRDG